MGASGGINGLMGAAFALEAKKALALAVVMVVLLIYLILPFANSMANQEVAELEHKSSGIITEIDRAVERGEIKATHQSEAAWMVMVKAAGLGNTFAVQRSLLKTDVFKYLEEMGDAKEIACPFTGEKHVALRTPKIDVFISHAVAASPEGNVQMFNGYSRLFEPALIASKTIITVEEIISNDEVMRNPYHTAIPGSFVDAVVKVPFGAHPYSLEGEWGPYYEADRDHLTKYVEMAKEPNGFKEYMDKYVFGLRDHWEYLGLIGLERLMELRHIGRV